MSRLPLVVALASVSVVSALHAANPNEFIVYNFDRYGNGISQDSNDLVGRLYVPANYDPTKSYPLVTFFHGNGERGSAEYAVYGTQNTQQVNSNLDNLLAAAKSNEFFLYAPQGWGGWGRDNINNAVNQVANISSQYNIDMGRLYVTGLSLGGGATMDALGSYSHVFAAGLNICGVSASPLYASKVATVPLWIHHAQNDGTVNINTSRNAVNAIRNAKGLGNLSFPMPGNYYDDGTLRYTEHTGGDHYIWGSVYAQSQVYTWMLAQTRTIPQVQYGDQILFDVGGAEVTSTVGGRTWNSTSYGLGSTLGPIRPFVKTSTGEGTSVVLSVTDTFRSETSTSSPAVTADGWFVDATNPQGSVLLSGLNPHLRYVLELFGSSTATNSLTRYTIGSEYQDLLTYNNSASTVIFSDVAPDPDGMISLTVSIAPGGGRGDLNWFSVTAVPEPSALAILIPVLVGSNLRRRRRD